MPNTTLSRRQFGQIALASLAASAASNLLAEKLNSIINGLHIGMQTFSMRMIRYPDIVAAVQQTGIGIIELFSGSVEPTAADAPDIMKWRDTISLDYFKGIRKKFNQAGIQIFSYNPRFGAGGGRGRGGANGPNGRGAGAAPGAAAPASNGPPATPPLAALPAPPITDAQIDRIFEFTKALGAKNLSSMMMPDVAKRIAPFAEKHKIVAAVASANPDVLTQIPPISPWLKLDVDIGDMTRQGHDALQFVKDNYQHCLDIHLKDIKTQGVSAPTSVPFGQGDSHMKEVLQFLAGKKTQVRVMIDCDYPGTGASVDEVKNCYDYIRSCLA